MHRNHTNDETMKRGTKSFAFKEYECQQKTQETFFRTNLLVQIDYERFKKN